MKSKAPVLKADYAIQKRIEVLYNFNSQQEQSLRKAEVYDKKMKDLGSTASWFETQQIQEVKKSKKVNDKRVLNELVLTHQEIKIRRYHQLKELYENEANL